MNDDRWDAVKILCDNEHWRRVWIVHEIYLGSQVVVISGHRRIPWQYLSELQKARKHIWPQYQSQGERDFLRSLPAKIDQQKDARAMDKCVLWTLMERFKDSLCQEVHDKVCGFMGLSTDSGSEGLIVDYTKTVGELYRDIISFYQKELGGPPGVPGQFLRANYVVTSASQSFVLKSFPNAPADVKKYGANDLLSFIPYSHIGSWRDQVDPYLSAVQTYENGDAFAAPDSVVPNMPSSFNTRSLHPDPWTRHPRLFTAIAECTDWNMGNKEGDAIGIAPAGCQIGDLVLTFVKSRIVLVLTPSALPSAWSQASRKVTRTYKLLGRACLLQVPGKGDQRSTSQLGADKTVETVQRLDI
jgi:hypothetical protein